MFEDCSLLIDHKKFVDIEKDIICPICLDILNEPFLCNKCQNNFCNNCITKWKINNSKCPICCTNADYIYNRLLKNIIPVLLRYINEKDNNKHEVEDVKEANILQNKKLKKTKIKKMQNEINKLKEANANLRKKNNELINKVADLEYEIEELINNNNDNNNNNSELNYDSQNESENEESYNDSQNESENEESYNDSQNESDEFDEYSSNQNYNNELNNNENREKLKQAIKEIRKSIFKNKNKK